jgi:predicted dehydrogenase
LDFYNAICDNNIPIYKDIKEFYESNTVDLAIISSPIHFHKEQMLYALSQGSHVLCEKPLCATEKDGLEMIEATEKKGLKVGIGYDWSYSDAILDLKKDIINGEYGPVKRMKTLVLWARDLKYYQRNNWAGKRVDKSGNYILDSVANNATAHYLHNMFFLLGDEIEKSAVPKSMKAELYRANDIENFDTCVFNIKTNNDVELLFAASHAVKEHDMPSFHIEFEGAVVRYGDDTNGEIAAFKDGKKIKKYGSPETDDIMKKLWFIMSCIKDGGNVTCPTRAAFSHTLCITAADSDARILDFPEEIVATWTSKENNEGVYVIGLSEILKECYSEWEMPYELDVPWAKKSERISLKKHIITGG